jgi:2-dehydro-3-deoxyphosphogluconate aldolase/(4S)-4-hydroxy-2-oxoglutarate aldolase
LESTVADALIEELRRLGVVPVVEIDDVETAAGLGRALVDAGLPVVEVTFRTPAARDAIVQMRSATPELAIGAGTVLDVDTVKTAIDAGADFLVSPGHNPAVSHAARNAGAKLIPGATTPTEIEAARSAGFRLLKFFPAEASGGIAMIKALSGPYQDVNFMPTGGVREDSLADWLSVPSVIACGGTWIAPRALIAARDFAEISRRATRAVAIAQHTRPTQK